MNNAIPEGPAYFHVLIERLSKSAVHVTSHADAGIVHQLDQFFIVFGGPEARAMEMEVESWELGGSNICPGQFHQRLGHGRSLGRGVKTRMRGELWILRVRDARLT